MAASYWGALPGCWAWITGEYMFDLDTGEDQPESVLEFARDASFRREK